MLSFAILAAGVALASAQSTTTSSVPTGPPMGVYKTAVAVPALTATTVIPSSATATIAQRDVASATTCLAQPTGISYVTVPDTAAAFLVDTFYSAAALAATTPTNYSSVFLNTQASPNADQYMGFTLMGSYDVQACSAQCSAISGCNSFNIYFERDPTVDPNDSSCLNPASVTQVKCVWWGSYISTAVNVNSGQWRGNFQVVIAGSNGYTRNAVSSSSSTATSTTSSVVPTTLVTAVKVAATSTTSTTTSAKVSSTTTSASTTTTSAAATSTNFAIQLNWSGTSSDNKYVVVSRSGVVSLSSSKSSATLFKLDASNNLINVSTKSAANVWMGSGMWQRINFASLGSWMNYASCSLTDPFVVCQVNNAYQYAGVCNNDGSLYFGTAERMPNSCTWVGLFPVYL